MPLPIILGVGAALAGVAGVGSGIHGAVKMKDANDTMKAAESRHKRNVERFESRSNSTNLKMDALGQLELEILKGFDEFSNIIEKIQNRPQFKEYSKDGVTLPKYDKEKLQNVSVGAGALLGGLGGAAAGTAGGFAAAGATTSAVMALGTASTGTAISSLSGAALTNATLAALGGGAAASGGGGIALGTTILGASTLGVGLLVGGMIFSFTGGKLSEKADEAYEQMKRAEIEIDKVCGYLRELEKVADKYYTSLVIIYKKYLESFNYISYVVNNLNKVEWNKFSEQEKIAIQNATILVGLLYKMCQVNLVRKSGNEDKMNAVNRAEVEESIENSQKVLENVDEYFAKVERENEIRRQERWGDVKEELRIVYSSTDIFEKYIQDTVLVSGAPNRLRIQAADKTTALFLKENCDHEIKIAVQKIYGGEKEIVYGYK